MQNLEKFSGEGQWRGKVSWTKVSAINSRFHQLQQTGHTMVKTKIF